MPHRCEGLPDGPCPEGVCNRTVKHTQGDLFLCPSCEAIRFPPAPQADSGMKLTRTLSDDTKKANIEAINAKSISSHIKSSESVNQSASLNSAAAISTITAAAAAASDTSDDDADGSGSVCPSCILPVKNDKRTIKCDICFQIFHQRCTPMSVKIFDKFVINVKVTGWTCDTCKQTALTSFRRLQTAISQLAEELTLVKSELSELKAIRDSNQHRMRVPAIEQQPEQQPELCDASEWRHGSEMADERVTLIVHRTLGSTARRLLIRLDSEHSVQELLRVAPMLRRSDDPFVAKNIFINADLSPAAAKLAYEARKLRRSNMQQRLQHNPETTSANQRQQSDETASSTVNSHADRQQLQFEQQQANTTTSLNRLNNGSANTTNTSNQVTLPTAASASDRPTSLILIDQPFQSF